MRRIRFERKLKQEAMAKILGLNQTDYSRIERNVKAVNDEEIIDFAKKMDVSPDDLYEQIENKTFNNYGEGTQIIGKNYNYQISPELQKLYEDKIALLEEKIKWLEGGK